LNAAVEAARAGEQGRGFAVVASEVRSLAQRSASAAREIKALISDSVEKVDAGTILVDQTGHTMGEIVDSVRRVTDVISEISAASQEQTSGIEQINMAITQMDEVTQQNAALVEQAAAAADSLREQAGQLEQVISIFKLNGHSTMLAATPRTATPRVMPNATRRALPKTTAALPRPTRKITATAPAMKNDSDWEEF
jgi:methyl-accepting chemotaxis protein